MKDYYGLLGVAPAASADEVKRAFRQQIARYHPDKVQHLGQEFQAMAADRAAELTEAYRILSDEGAARKPTAPVTGRVRAAASCPVAGRRRGAGLITGIRRALGAAPGGSPRAHIGRPQHVVHGRARDTR